MRDGLIARHLARDKHRWVLVGYDLLTPYLMGTSGLSFYQLLTQFVFPFTFAFIKLELQI